MYLSLLLYYKKRKKKSYIFKNIGLFVLVDKKGKETSINFTFY